ncbi:hypothetical protein DL96DRAFT_1627840 [Flagelloscypha sp. PMI_526]|nr:hypothetical protein DL96DRAFT_1627840 [Flagelloscypha sp. PMI_526]
MTKTEQQAAPTTSQPHGSQSALPAELWQLIAAHLTPRELWRLRGLSAAFLNQCRAEKYGVLKIKADYRARPRLQLLLEGMRSRAINLHVHSLIVSTEAEYRMFYSQKQALNPTLFPPPKNEWRMPTVHATYEPIITAIKNALPCLSNVRDLTVEYDGSRPSYMLTMWKYCPKNLTTLKLKFDSPCASTVSETLPSSLSASSFPHLKSFTLDMTTRGGLRPGHTQVRKPVNATDSKVVKACISLMRTLVKFLPNDVLEELYLKAGRYNVLFLGNPDSFPQLKALMLREPPAEYNAPVRSVGAEEMKAVEEFVKRHATTGLKALDAPNMPSLMKYIP